MEALVVILLLLGLGGSSPRPGAGRPGGRPQLPGRPAGDPPGGCLTFDPSRWPDRQAILDGFAQLGYQTPTLRDTMNDLGPDGQLGGGDDIPNPEVAQFQRDYNEHSRRGHLGPGAGGLDVDGFVGPCTVNGLQHAIDTVGGANWGGVTVGGLSG